MQERRKPSAAGRGFSLIEVLVAISIIALLISIMIPALSKARDAGRAAMCLSNQRQLGIAMNLYANSNNGFVPREGVDNVTRERPPWAVALRPYIDSSISPDEEPNDRFAGAPFFRDPSRKPDAHVIHYVTNAIPFRKVGTERVPDASAAINWRKRRGPTMIDRVINPSGVVYLTDYFDDPNGHHAASIYVGSAPTDMQIAQWYDLWLAGHVNGGPLVRRMEPRRHGTGCNALFFDGHASTVTATDVKDLKLWDDGLTLTR
ncbi:MAG: DUF1559 domain-containing protein [Phycisphaeraceae bacterium]|nr:DUF1559 domain-containing protein [Phycisphaeraceae bacterium]